MRVTKRAIAAVFVLLLCNVSSSFAADKDGFEDSFDVNRPNLASTGRSDYFILDPGHQLVLEGVEKGEAARLVITVLEKTKDVDGVRTRIVERRKTVGGKLAEVRHEFVAIDRASHDVFAFGADVDEYKNEIIVGHAGSWLAGKGDARVALIMPGKPQVGRRFYQALAPNSALLRCEIITTDEKLEVPVGSFDRCVKIADSQAAPPDPDALNTRFTCHAPGIGLVIDGMFRLVKHGMNIEALAGADEKGQQQSAPLEPIIPYDMARAALDFVGADPEAEAAWLAAINDPAMTPKQRQDLIEDLNEQGFADPHNVTPDELPLVLNRLALIEQIAPDAMDETNAAAFAEAYKDLINIAERLMR